MGLDIENVQVMQKQKGTNHLVVVRTNPYIRLISEGEFPVILQGGKFYTDGGDRLLVRELGQWVKATVRAMTKEAREKVGLGEDWDQQEEPAVEEPRTNTTQDVEPSNDWVKTAEEPSESEQPASDDVQTLKTPEPEPTQPDKTIVDVVYELDPHNDDHWTDEGKPDLAVLAFMMNDKYTDRDTVEEATEGYRRPVFEETSDGDSDSSTTSED